MADRPKIKDFQEGRLSCPGCSTDIHINDYEGLEVTNCPSCNSPVFIPMKVKDYWLFKPLGGGGMGSVYESLCESDSGEFAVKILPREKNTDPELIETITREGEIGKILGKCQFIAEVVDYGCAEGEYYMASRFVEGTRLDVFISTASHLSERQALDIILQVIDAEMHIINCGFLFRDIKPENIIVIEETGQVKLFDFGLCMSLEQAANPDPSDALEGSPFYIPPERIVAASEGEHSEIYSLGMLLFHMLSGTTYFSESDIKNLLTKHVGALRVASVTNRLKHCSPEISAILDKMIKRDPNQRYHQLAPLRQELAELREKAEGYSLADAGKPEPTANGTTAPKKPMDKKKRLTILLVTLLVVAIGVGGWNFLNYQAEQTRKQELRLAAARRLKIPIDVAKPKLPPAEVNKKVNEEYQRLYDQRSAQYPPFDESAAKAAICKDLSISITMTKDPDYTIKQLDSLANKQIKLDSDREIKKQLGSFSEENVKKYLAEKMGIGYPVVPPTKTLKEIERKLTEEAEQKAKEKYSSKVLASDTMNILKTYRNYREGDRVTVSDHTGAKFSGLYKGKDGRKVIIGTRKVRLNDLTAGERIKFNPGLCSSKAAESVKRLKNDFNQKRAGFIKDYINKEGADIFEKYGYKLEKDKWVSNADIIDQKADDAKKEFSKKLRANKKKIQEQVKKKFNKEKFIQRHGYCKIKGKWYSQKAAIKMLLKKKKNAYNSERNKKLAKIKKDTRKEVETKIYKENTYIFYENRWQPAFDALEREVMRTSNQTQ